MKNYLTLNGKKIELTEEQARQIAESFTVKPSVRLGDVPVGQVAKIGEYEFVVLEHNNGTTQLIMKDILEDDVKFGEDNNDYRKSNVRAKLQEFADKLASIVGGENIIEHAVDLTSEDGLKDYGNVMERVSLLTAEMYRKYVDILDMHKPNVWWWLATPHSTARHENVEWVKCVSPSGGIDYYDYGSNIAVRPFCILNSDLFI